MRKGEEEKSWYWMYWTPALAVHLLSSQPLETHNGIPVKGLGARVQRRLITGFQYHHSSNPPALIPP